MAANEIICPMCGFKNAPNTARCVSCGAKLEAVGADVTDDEGRPKRGTESFDWKWAFISLGIFIALQGVILGALPKVISTFDPQGFSALLLTIGVCMLGGVIVGLVSPGRTVFEPAVGALIAAVPTIGYIMFITPTAFGVSLPAYIMGGLIGVSISLFGAFLGEKIQGGKRAA